LLKDCHHLHQTRRQDLALLHSKMNLLSQRTHSDLSLTPQNGYPGAGIAGSRSEF
jgi:hypothetical protein